MKRKREDESPERALKRTKPIKCSFYDLKANVVKPMSSLEDSQCWMACFDIPSQFICCQGDREFEEMWKLCPNVAGAIFDRLAFKTDYFLGGHLYKSCPLPECLRPYEKWASTRGNYNQIMVSWFNNGLNYSDWKRNVEGELHSKDSTTLMLCLGQARTFRVKKRSGELMMEINTESGRAIEFGGETKRWSDYTKETVKASGERGKNMKRRIEIWFRRVLKKGTIL